MLSKEDLLELVTVGAEPAFLTAYGALRGVFHRAFLAVDDDGEIAVDYMQVQPHAQALLAYPVLTKVVELKEQTILDEIVALPWTGDVANVALVGEQLANLDALNWAMGLAGHRPLGLQLVGEQKVSLIALVRLFRAFGAVYRYVVMVREQKRLQDEAADAEGEQAVDRIVVH